jgi:ubiquinone/menaquinone biosynthesis C-methylase UbiE
MELAEVQKHWDALGRTDPLWAILTVPSKRYGGWDLAEFFASGRQEIAAVMREVEALGLPSDRRRRALDFGCGVGRLTQALCEHFEDCTGVDIAPSMVEQARRFNRHGDRCRYVLNPADDLKVFGDCEFDFVYSFIVLQHVEPKYIEAYLREFVRVLAPGGLICVQIPSERVVLALDPLPPSAFRAAITLLDPPSSLAAGESSVVRALVENRSDVAWPSHGSAVAERQINLGNHWLDAAGRVVVESDGRSVLPCELAPGGRAEFPLAVRSPETPGRYLLEVDLVQEAVAWFAWKGSPAARAEVRVTRPRKPLRETLKAVLRFDRGQPLTGPEGFTPLMEMYVLPEARVREVVQDGGGSVVAAHGFSGGDYRHVTYFITR